MYVTSIVYSRILVSLRLNSRLKMWGIVGSFETLVPHWGKQDSQGPLYRFSALV